MAIMYRNRRRSLSVRAEVSRTCVLLIAGCLTSSLVLAQSSTDLDECYKPSGTIEQAIDACTRAINSGQLSQPNLANSYINRGAKWSEKREYDRAISDYDKALAIDPQNALAHGNRSRSWVRMCYAAASSGDPDLGIRHCNRAIDSDQMESEGLSTSYVNRGLDWKIKGEYEHALSDFNAAVRANPNSASAYTVRGDYYRLRGQETEATADFDRGIAVPIKADDATSYLNRARAYIAKGDLNAALADLNEAGRINPKNLEVYVSRASIHSSRSDYEHAIADLDGALRLTPSNARLLRERGHAYLSTGNFERALTDYDASISVQGDVPDGYADRAWIHRLQGDQDQAIVDYNQAIRLDPKRGVRYAQRAQTYVAKGDWKAAFNDYDRAIQVEPDRGANHSGRAWMREYTGDYVGALADRDDTIRLEPRDADWRVYRAWTLLYMGRTDDGLAGFADAIQLDPRAADHYQSRGYALARLSRFDEALADFDRAIQLQPGRGEYYASRAEVFLYKGDPLAALPDIERAHAHDPNYESADNLARAELAGGKLDEAIRGFSSYIAARPATASGFDGRGFARWMKGDFAGAADDFRRSLVLNSLDAETEIWLYLVRARLGQGSPADIVKVSRRFDPKKWPSPVFRFIRGEITRDQMVESAADRSSLKAAEQEVQAYFFAGEHYLATNRTGDARAMFREVLKRKLPSYYSSIGAGAELKTHGPEGDTSAKSTNPKAP
jgi:tetratricopeptide (TPR) repeat protein